MKKISALLLAIGVTAFAVPVSRAAILSSIPGPDDQGGMIMPMVVLSGGSLFLSFSPPSNPPDLKSLNGWSPGNSFAPTVEVGGIEQPTAWYSKLDPVGGEGALFNNQYGFTFMAMNGELLPAGTALGIRLTNVSSPFLQSWNYSNGLNLFDEIFLEIGDQVLWNGSMWHNYFTLPADAAPGIYTAQFEVFVANAAFTSGTGFADYSATAQNAAQNTSYNSVTINYSWEVVPEPSSYLLLLGGLAVVVIAHRRKRRLGLS